MCLIYKNINYKWSLVCVEAVAKLRTRGSWFHFPPRRRCGLLTRSELVRRLSWRHHAGLLRKIEAKFHYYIERKVQSNCILLIYLSQEFWDTILRSGNELLWTIIGGKWASFAKHSDEVYCHYYTPCVIVRVYTIMSWRRRVCDYARGLGLGNLECNLGSNMRDALRKT